VMRSRSDDSRDQDRKFDVARDGLGSKCQILVYWQFFGVFLRNAKLLENPILMYVSWVPDACIFAIGEDSFDAA
jgi:hypothetical protein